MANIADGTYLILNVSNTALAMDSCGATDGNNANVDLATIWGYDGQLVRVWTAADASRQMMFSATGKCVDVKGYTEAADAEIVQYDNNSTSAKKWNIVDTGATSSYNGVTYSTYKIVLSSKSTLAIGANTTTEGSKLYLKDSTSGSNIQWMFVERNSIPSGTYVIRPKIDLKMCMDVCGASTATGARVQLYAPNGNNNQTFWLHAYDSTGRMKLTAVHSMQLVEIDNTNDAQPGDNVLQCGDYGGTDQMWISEPNGTAVYNSVTMPCYRLHNYAAQGLAVLMDAANGGTTPAQFLRVFYANGNDAQRWIFEPTEMLAAALPVPADITASTTSGDPGGTIISANAKTNIWPSWMCDGTTYQCRYRYRSRAIGKRISAWGVWRSIADASASNNGWGSIGYPNCTAGNTTRKYSSVPAVITPVDNTSIDYAEIQLEARRFEANYNSSDGLNAHGNSASAVISLAWKPTITITACGWSPDGITIGYSSDYHRNGNTFTINKISIAGKTLCDAHVFQALPYSGSVNIPIEDLKFIPANNAACVIDASYTTDATSTDESYSTDITYDASQGITITPTYAEGVGHTLLATIAKHTYDSCYMLYDGKLTKCDEYSSTATTVTYLVVQPLNAEFSLCYSSRSGSKWATYVETISKHSCDYFVWYWGADKCAVVALGDKPGAQMSNAMSIDATKQKTTGREYPVFRFGESKSKDLSVSGVYVDGYVTHGNYSDLEELIDAHHAKFRTPWGKIYEVVITDVDLTRNKSDVVYGDVTVKQEAETI